jgi:hypothetical protein
MQSTKKRTLLAFPLFKNNLITAADVRVLPVPVAISNRNRVLFSFTAFLIERTASS